MNITKTFLKITLPVIGLLLLTGRQDSFAQVTLQAKNTATATGTAPGNVSVSDISNDGLTINRLLSDQTPVIFPVIGIGKTATVSTIKADGSYDVLYTITIKNFGTIDLKKVQVTDVLTNTFPSPLTYTLIAAPAKTGTIALAAGYDGTAANSALLDPANSTLVAGASATITINLSVKLNGAAGGTTYNNTARVSAVTNDDTPVFDDSNNSTDPDGDGDGSPLDDNIPTPVVLQTRDIAVTKTVNNATPNVGDNVIFTVTVKNNGPAVAEGVEVVDLLPAGYTFVSASPSAGAYDPATGKWTVGTLTNAATQTLAVTGKVVPAKTAAEYKNTASSNLIADSESSNNSASVSTTPVQLPPVPVNDSKTGNTLGADVTLNILSNDKVSDGSLATSSNSTIDIDVNTPGVQTTFTKTGEGVWTYNSTTGEVTFNPDAGFTVDPTPLAYTLKETLTGLSANATVTITYIPTNPVAEDDSSTGNTLGANATVNLLTNDKLGDSSGALPGLVTVDLDLTTAGVQTTLTVALEGVWTYNTATGALVFDPNTGFTKDPTAIPYTLTEKLTGLSDNATVSMTYVKGPPVASDDSSTANTPGTNVTQNILTNDKLSDGSSALPALVAVDLDPSTPAIDLTKTVTGEGVWTYNPVTGNLTFDPNSGFTTDPTALPYKLTETLTGLSANASVTVGYTKVPPVAANDSSLGNTPGATVTQNILTNDKLSDGTDALPALVTVDLDPSSPAIDVTKTVTGEGVWTYDPTTGNLTFDPNAGFTTDPTALPYKLIEKITGLSANATVTVGYTEVPPVAANDSSTGNTPGANVTQNILTNDKLSDGSPALPALVTIDLDPSTPTIDLSRTVAGEGVWTYDPATGNLTFDPNTGFTTNPTALPYKLIEKITGLSSSASVTVTYAKLPPDAVNDIGTSTVPGVNVVNILTNDKLSDGSPATPDKIIVDLDPSTPGVQNTKTVTGEGTWTYDPATGNTTFVPVFGFITNPTPIPYELKEVGTGLTDIATISFNTAISLKIGIGKTVSAPKLEGNGSYTFTYTMNVKNYGNVALNDVKVTDDLKTAFPSPMNVKVNAIIASGTLKANIGYNGTNNLELLSAGSTLPIGATETITLTVNVMPNGSSGVFENSATATGTGANTGGVTTDVSNDGLNPDPNGNNNPSEGGEAKPTPISLDPTNVVIPEGFSPNGDGVNDKFELENVGPRRINLEIYNRWGNLVYKNPDYKNDWDGTCNAGIYVGQNVPDGTYYYIAIIDGKEKRVRFITINR
ncbi:gliding motility-associated C-terminal domain-containing protein [Desertivirga brevis]|uniref:T9SS type B sorting domain-containing protein n=1 Tax=Desertivirga brevis TaxID=2810310 RepID=UPI001A95A665|nr:gliding motility-associated C-terminal domain-containing protein [Pedobacter sp. SYSU D00873]